MKTNPPFSVILLSGGSGLRMESEIPKQYIPICQKPLALYSFEALLSIKEVLEFIVVCEPQYRSIFQESVQRLKMPRTIQFALPGPRRQDSVFNGIQLLTGNPLVCIHDSARPLIDSTLVRRAVMSADSCGACALGVKVKSTIKVCDDENKVIDTPNRSFLWEIQTPQIVRLNLLKEGFSYVQEHQLTVTDDVSLVESMSGLVKIVEGTYSNIKVTTREDLICVEKLIEKQEHVLL